MRVHKRVVWFTGIGVILGVILMGGCASSKKAPVDRVAKAEMAIDRARQSEAQTYAPLELKLAEEKLETAKASMAEKEYDQVRRLAEEALLDAEVAEGKARSEKTKEIALDLRKSIKEIRREMDRLHASD